MGVPLGRHDPYPAPPPQPGCVYSTYQPLIPHFAPSPRSHISNPPHDSLALHRLDLEWSDFLIHPPKIFTKKLVFTDLSTAICRIVLFRGAWGAMEKLMSDESKVVHCHPVLGEIEIKALSASEDAVKFFGEALGMAKSMGRDLVVECVGHDPRRVGCFLTDHCGCGEYPMSTGSGDSRGFVRVRCSGDSFHAPAVVRTSELRYDFGDPDESKDGCGCDAIVRALDRVASSPVLMCSASPPRTGKPGIRFVSGAEFARLLNERYYRLRRTPPIADPKSATELVKKYHPKADVGIPVSTEGLPPVVPTNEIPSWAIGLTDGDPSIKREIAHIGLTEGLRGLAAAYGIDSVAFEGGDVLSVTVPNGKFMFDFPGAESVSGPRPFKVGDLVRVSEEHTYPFARGKLVRVSEVGDASDDGWLYGNIENTDDRIGMDPKNATLVDEAETPVDAAPRSGRTTRMLLRAVHDALEGKSSRVVTEAGAPFSHCCMFRKAAEKIAIASPVSSSLTTESISRGEVLKFGGLSKRVRKEGEPEFVIKPAVIEFVPHAIASGLESPPADWNHWNDNGEDRS